MKALPAVFLVGVLLPFAALAADHAPPVATMTISISPYPPPRELFPDEDPTSHYGTRWAVSLDAEGRVTNLESEDDPPKAIRPPPRNPGSLLLCGPASQTGAELSPKRPVRTPKRKIAPQGRDSRELSSLCLR